ncbi:hypothetical protein Lal_00039519, partial [Lupinus albus]
FWGKRNSTFGGKVIIFCGDFTQILPVLTLTRNMRLRSTINNTNYLQIQQFEKWILVVGDGKLSESNDGTYPNLVDDYMNEEFLQCRAILASTIDTFDEINDYVLSLISALQGLTTEFLNSLKTSGLPNHKIKLKVGTPIMLLRNLDQTEGLCNVTKMIVNRLATHVIEAKSQGKSLTSVGFYLPRPVFGHGQLYVVFSRIQSIEGLKILLHDKEGKTMNTTINVVFKELFQNL